MKVSLVSKTTVDPNYARSILEDDDIIVPPEFEDVLRDVEGLIAYIARVSSSNQTNPKFAGLIRFCIKHGHWSILEMANAVFEIHTSRGISPQILRHRSFSFQEFSQRYAAVDESGIEIYVARRQDKKNRQNSTDDLPEKIKQEWERRQLANWKSTFEHYQWALDNEIAKECARMVLPLQCTTKLFANGTIRSWVHYLNLRCDKATQKEHRDIALAIREQFIKEFPIIAEAMEWTNSGQ